MRRRDVVDIADIGERDDLDGLAREIGHDLLSLIGHDPKMRCANLDGDGCAGIVLTHADIGVHLALLVFQALCASLNNRIFG